MNYIVSVLLADEVAEHLGKKGSENGLTFHNGTHMGNRIVALSPTSMEDKFYAVAESILLSDAVVVGTSRIDKAFGEMLVACSLVERKVILTDDGDASNVMKGIGISGIDVSDRFGIADRLSSVRKRNADSRCRVDIDKAFPVTGIGTVVLGFVTKGRISVHDKLVLPSGTEVSVKSIQSNDVDVESAEVGTRVGLALKGAKSEDFKKGDVLSPSRVVPCRNAGAALRQTEIGREDMNGNTYGFVSGFSYTSAVISVEGDAGSIRLERPIPLEEGDEFMLIRKKEPRIFASGRVLSTTE